MYAIMTANVRFGAMSAITMSAARQKTRILLLMLGICLGAGFVAPVWSAVSGPIVTDPQTGLAIDGFDPVA